jgi:very-short-patch-repair endonuclease
MTGPRPLHHPARPDGPPPRSGEELGRVRHRTVGAPVRTIKRARKLRKEMSLPEVLLWQQLRQRPGGFRFRKQFPQDQYVIDFACLAARLAIEVDGEAHDRGDRPERDVARDAHLTGLGFSMMRIPAWEVLGNLEGVLLGIVEQCRTLRPLHRPTDGPPPRSGEDLR